MKKRVTILCHLFGHQWVYKNFEDWMRENGTVYKEKKKRKCMRCGKREDLKATESDEWVINYDSWIGI